MSRSSIKAGSAYVEISTRDKFSRGLMKAQARFKAVGATVSKIGATIAAAGASMVAPIALAAKQFANLGDRIHKMSARTGISAESLSEIGFAAEQSGASLEDVGAAVQKMNRRLGRLSVGEATATQEDAVRKLGLSIEELSAMDPENRFLAIADAMANYGDQAAAAGLAQRAFGTGVDKLLPLLMEGREGIAALRSEAKDLGRQISTEDAQAAADLTDAWNRLKSIWTGVKTQIGAAVARPLAALSNTIVAVTENLSRWIKQNRGLVQAIAAAGAAMIAIGGTVAALGAGLIGLGATAGAVASLIGTVFSPVGAVIAGIAAVVGVAGVAFYRFATGGSEAAQFLRERFGALIGFVKDVVGSMGDALAAGDLKLAAKIAWAGIKVAFFQGLIDIGEFVPKLIDAMVAKFTAFFRWIKDAAIGAFGSIVKAGEKIAKGDLAGAFLEAIKLPQIDFGQGKGANHPLIQKAIAASTELAQLQAEAERKRKAREAEKSSEPSGAGAKPETKVEMPDVEKKLEKLGEKLDQSRPQIPNMEGAAAGVERAKNVGVFSGFAASLLAGRGAADPAKKTAKNTEEMAESLKSIDRNLGRIEPTTYV